jgi:NADH-quinone oxidoreductase subunit J
VQVIVYAGAIVVLFLFVTMLIGNKEGPRYTPGKPIAKIAAIVLSVALLAELVYGGLSGVLSPFHGEASEEAIAQIGNVQALGQALFTDYLLPVEMVSVLLLIAMVGAVVLAKKPANDKQTER